MKKSFFGDPRPGNHAEMVEVLDEKGSDPYTLHAEMSFSKDEGDEDYNGWSAEVRENESGDEVFSTIGYENKEALRLDLVSAGITDIEEANNG